METTSTVPQQAPAASHPDIFCVRPGAPGDYQSCLISLKDFKAGDIICPLTGYIPSPRTRMSFQCGEQEHLDFNSDIVFSNHSCDPNIGLDLSSPERDNWSVVCLKDVKSSDEITWCYATTEWDAWGGGFPCNCGTERCLGAYRGSKAMSLEALASYAFVAPHVSRLAAAREKVKQANGHAQPLKIAYAFDRRTDYLALGFSEEECAEFDSDHTIDCVAASLRNLGEVEMIGNFHSLVARLAVGAHSHWDLVFNYTEGIRGVGREARTPSLLEAFGVNFTMSDAATQALCLDKCKTKMVLQFYGVPTAPFAIVPGVHEGQTIPFNHAMTALQDSPHHSELCFPLFAKPSAEGSSKGILPISKINSADDFEASVARLLTKFPAMDVIIETYLAGREFCVGIFGAGAEAKVFGVVEYVFKKGQSDGGPLLLDYLSYDLKNASTWAKPEFVNCDLGDAAIKAVADVGLKAWRVMGCSDAGSVDIRHDKRGKDARPYVLEVNTIPGLTPDRAVYPVMAQANGISFDQLIAEIVYNALQNPKCAGTPSRMAAPRE